MTDIQDDLIVSGDSISGKLKYLDTGDIADTYGAGYYMALDFTDNDLTNLTSAKVGMSPSAGVEMIELTTDATKKCIFKVSNKFNQKFVINQTDGDYTKIQSYDLSRLELVKN